MNDFPSRNVFPHTAAINAQGHLVLGGCDVMDLAGEYGTPLYVYDEETLRKVCRQYGARVRNSLPLVIATMSSHAVTVIEFPPQAPIYALSRWGVR